MNQVVIFDAEVRYGICQFVKKKIFPKDEAINSLGARDES